MATERALELVIATAVSHSSAHHGPSALQLICDQRQCASSSSSSSSSSPPLDHEDDSGGPTAALNDRRSGGAAICERHAAHRAAAQRTAAHRLFAARAHAVAHLEAAARAAIIQCRAALMRHLAVEASLASKLVRGSEEEEDEKREGWPPRGGTAAAARRSGVPPIAQQDPSIAAYATFLSQKVVDEETLRVRRDRRARVSELLRENRESEGLRVELRLRAEHAARIAAEVRQQEAERAAAMHARTEALREHVAAEVAELVQYQAQHDDDEAARRVEAVRSLHSFMSDHGDHPRKVAASQASRERLAAINQESYFVRRGFVKAKKKKKEARAVRRGAPLPLAGGSEDHTSSSCKRGACTNGKEADVSISPSEVAAPEREEEQEPQPQRSTTVAGAEAAQREDRGGVDSARRRQMEREKLRQRRDEALRQRQQELADGEAHVRARHDAARRQQRCEDRRAVELARQRSGEARARHDAERAAAHSSQEDWDAAARELRGVIRATGNERRRQQRREAREQASILRERVAAALERSADLSEHERRLWREELEHAQAAHRLRLEAQHAREAELREARREQFLRRHETEAAQQRELELLREQRRAEESRAWQERCRAKAERAEVAKLQAYVQKRNRVMAEKAESLMATEAILIADAQQRMHARDLAEQQQAQALARVDWRRKVALAMYGGAGPSHSRGASPPPGGGASPERQQHLSCAPVSPICQQSQVAVSELSVVVASCARSDGGTSGDGDGDGDRRRRRLQRPPHPALLLLWDTAPAPVPFMTLLAFPADANAGNSHEAESGDEDTALASGVGAESAGPAPSPPPVAAAGALRMLLDASASPAPALRLLCGADGAAAAAAAVAVAEGDAPAQGDAAGCREAATAGLPPPLPSAPPSAVGARNIRAADAAPDHASPGAASRAEQRHRHRPKGRAALRPQTSSGSGSGIRPLRVLPLPNPSRPDSTVPPPSLAFPTPKLLSRAKISEELRGRAERLMNLEREVKCEEQMRWYGQTGMRRRRAATPLALAHHHGSSGGDSVEAGAGIRSPSARLTQRTITQDARRELQRQEAIPWTIHDGAPPVRGVSRRLYDPSGADRSGSASGRAPDLSSQPRRRDGVDAAVDGFVRRFHEEAVTKHRAELARATAACVRPLSRCPQLDEGQREEAAARLYSHAARQQEQREKTLAALESRRQQQRTPHGRGRGGARLRAGEHAARFHDAEIEVVRREEQRLSSKYGVQRTYNGQSESVAT